MGIGIWRRLAVAGAGSAVAVGVTAAIVLALVAAAVAGASSTILLLHALGLAGVGYGLAQVRAARIWADKVSGEVDAVSKRLLRLEAALSEPDRATGSHVRSALADMTGEIALLGNVLRDLAGTVAAHDREISALQSREDADLRPVSVSRKVIARAEPETPPIAPPEHEADPSWMRPGPAAGAALRPAVSAPEMMPMLDGHARAGTSDSPPSRGRPGSGADGERLAAHEPPQAASDPIVLHRRPDSSASIPAPAAALAAQPLLGTTASRAGRERPQEGHGVAAIVEAFESERIELHLQPIVALPQRRIRIYEVLARLRLADGQVLVPAEFMGPVERVGLAAELDRRVFTRAIVLARHLMSRGSEATVSCNLSPATVADAGALRAIAKLLEPHPDLMGRLILEISQRCWRTLDAERAGILAGLRDRGLPFALDRANDLRLDPLSLAERGVRFAKMPAAMLLQPEGVAGLDIAVGDLAAVLGRAGIRLVAERVEREEDVPDLIDLDVPMGQGFAFAPPRPLRSDVVAAGDGTRPAPAPPATSTSMQEPRNGSERTRDLAPALAAVEPRQAADARQPYRSFLRRVG